MNLRKQFRDRDELRDYLRDSFPEAGGDMSPFVGGRGPADRLLHSFEPSRYAATRNFLTGSVSRLSPYLRHGVLTLREVLDDLRLDLL